MSGGGGAGWDFVFRSPMVDNEAFVQQLLDRDGRLLRFQERFGDLQENGILNDPIIVVEEEEDDEESEEELMEDDVAPVYVGATPDILYQNSEAVQRFHRMQRAQELRQVAEQQANAIFLREQMAQRMLVRGKQVDKQIEEEEKRKKEAAKKEKLKKKKKSKKNDEDDEEVVQAEYKERERDEAVIKFEQMLIAQRAKLIERNSRFNEIKKSRTRSNSAHTIITVDSRPKPLDDEGNPMSNSETFVQNVSSFLQEDEEDVDSKKEEDAEIDQEEEEDITIEETLQLDTDPVVTNNENPADPHVAWGWRAIGYGTLWGTGQAGNNEENEQNEEEVVEVTPLEEALNGIALIEFILRVGTPTSMLDSQLGMGIGVQFYQAIRSRVDGFRTVYYMEALVALIEDLYKQVAEILGNNEELYDNAVIGDALNDIQRIIEAIGSQRSIPEDGLFHQFPNIPDRSFSRLKALIAALAMKNEYSKSDETLMAAAQKLVVSQVEAKKEAFESAAKQSTDEDNDSNVIVE
ncbi:MAG TPA: hypothetical protein DIU37_04375 [Opitutae bacterium]|nr:hypothetical protein [Opitutae bacterium]|tara:strand:- start:271 stop:1830 length:1560 start_codon:yes stop_codon:yes gene_type:complete